MHDDVLLLAWSCGPNQRLDPSADAKGNIIGSSIN